jgi:hypothetical protein
MTMNFPIAARGWLRRRRCAQRLAPDLGVVGRWSLAETKRTHLPTEILMRFQFIA